MRTISSTRDVAPGASAPLGATVLPGGVNFSVFSKHAALLELLLFDDENAAQPARIIPLDGGCHRTYHYWHAFVPGLQPGQVYAYRAHGPFDPERGLRFDAEKVSLDPYGLAVARPRQLRPLGRGAARRQRRGRDEERRRRSRPVRLGRRSAARSGPSPRPSIYELHVRGFTRHPSSGVAPAKRGTYAGLIEKIPYLKDLGVTAVELLPVFQFDPQDAPPGKTNYWGYAARLVLRAASRVQLAEGPARRPRRIPRHGQGAPSRRHRSDPRRRLQSHDEGGADGPTFCYRGLANDVYYILEKDKSRYADYTGCGNTLNANQSIVRRLIQDSLRYWVTEMHVDGFRFDLASILSRDEDGRPLPNPPVLWDIESDPLLAGTKLIAEAWDAAGLYQVGSFIGDTLAGVEWPVPRRRPAFPQRRQRLGVRAWPHGILGSPDIYGHKEREAEQSINFVTCHDGFTLNDLVSYNRKHNEANGENNRDGSDDNLSWNCGVEGPTDDPRVEALRNRQVKNFFALELLSAGTPMLLMGDEVRRTPEGQQQRLLPGLRHQLVRLDAAGAARRHPPIRESAYQVSPTPGRVGGSGGAQPESTASPGAHRVARGGAATPGLERPLAFPCPHAAKLARPVSAPRDAQRLLGTADIRIAARSRRAGMAALDRYRADFTRRYLPLGVRTCGDAGDL